MFSKAVLTSLLLEGSLVAAFPNIAERLAAQKLEARMYCIFNLR